LRGEQEDRGVTIKLNKKRRQKPMSGGEKVNKRHMLYDKITEVTGEEEDRKGAY